jgi:hypothetical protein
MRDVDLHRIRVTSFRSLGRPRGTDGGGYEAYVVGRTLTDNERRDFFDLVRPGKSDSPCTIIVGPSATLAEGTRGTWEP